MWKKIFGWIDYVICLLVIVFLLAFFQSYGLFLLLCFWILFPLFAWFHGRYMRKRTEISLRVRSEKVKAEGINDCFIKVTPAGKSALGKVKAYLRVTDTTSGDGIFSIVELPVRRKEHEIRFPIASNACGTVVVELTKAVFPSFLSLFSFEKELGCRTEFAVFPHRMEIVSEEKSVFGIGNEELAEDDVKGENSSQIKDITNYKPGDRMQKIHWKASARKDELMVKEYAGTLSDKVNIVVELVKDRKVFHDIVTLAYSFGCMQIEKDGKISFSWWNDAAGIWTHKSLLSVEEFEEALREMFFMELYEMPHKAEEMLRVTEDIGGKVFYVSQRTQGNDAILSLEHASVEVLVY